MSDQSKELRWGRFIFLSLLLHLCALSLLLFVPDAVSTRKISGPTVYEVNLVSLPAAKPKAPAKSVQSKAAAKKKTHSRKATVTQRISPPPKKEKPVVIGKRTVKKKKSTPRKPPKAKKPKASPSKLIDRAVARIKKNVRTHKGDQHLNRAISNIRDRVEKSEKSGSGSGSVEGIAIRMYQMEVEARIKSNWQYPVALTSPSKRKDLVATVVVKVRQDGTILKSWFIDRSGNAIFDDSTIKAVARSDPLPPFPEGYHKRQDEMEIRFNLSELEEH
ncbi:MAG: TonB C-terminal domain-containing protein [Deltaproteobacteria bacterium]|nr:TonB C-terminal domain-containing protein [Deltaproteobacteria bacterium]